MDRRRFLKNALSVLILNRDVDAKFEDTGYRQSMGFDEMTQLPDDGEFIVKSLRITARISLMTLHYYVVCCVFRCRF